MQAPLPVLVGGKGDRMLRLAVRARPLISAVATFTVVGDGDRCVLSFEEEPALRPVDGRAVACHFA